MMQWPQKNKSEEVEVLWEGYESAGYHWSRAKPVDTWSSSGYKAEEYLVIPD